MSDTSLDDIINQAQSEEIDVDFSGAQDFTPLPDNDYRARVVECNPDKTKDGNPKLVWKYEVVEGEHKGRTLFKHTPTTGKGAGFAREAIRATGVEVDSERIKFKPSASIGSEVILTVRRQKDNEDFNDIKKVKAAPAASAL